MKKFNFFLYITLIDSIIFDKTSSLNDFKIRDKDLDMIVINNNNQLTTYLWTSTTNGPQCRIKYTIVKNICTMNNAYIGAKCMLFLLEKE